MTERQKFDLVKKIAGSKVEIRRYHPCVMADVIVEAPYSQAPSLGFRPLVTYISKNNIAMTAPVLQESTDLSSWIISFVMPAEMKLEDLPILKAPKSHCVLSQSSSAHHLDLVELLLQLKFKRRR